MTKPRHYLSFTLLILEMTLDKTAGTLAQIRIVALTVLIVMVLFITVHSQQKQKQNQKQNKNKKTKTAVT